MKVIVFDFDGTLTQNRKGSNCWQEVWKSIDGLSYDDFLYQKYARHEIDIKQWFDLVIERFKEKNVELKNLHNIAKTIKLLPGGVIKHSSTFMTTALKFLFFPVESDRLSTRCLSARRWINLSLQFKHMI